VHGIRSCCYLSNMAPVSKMKIDRLIPEITSQYDGYQLCFTKQASAQIDSTAVTRFLTVYQAE
jgi:hypothetical protein